MFLAGPIPSEHRLRLGLQGSLIPFAPLAFVPQRQSVSSYLPSPSVFLSISTDFTPTWIVPVAPKPFNPTHLLSLSEVKLQDLKQDVVRRLRTLYAQ
jgi:hypothetical protein